MEKKNLIDVLFRMVVVMCAVFIMAAGMIINVDSAAAEDPEWTISPASQIGGWHNDMTVSGDYAYLTEGYSLRVLDITGDNPVVTGSVYLGGEPSRIFVKDNYVYAIAQEQRDDFICIVDVSTPSDPTLLGSCNVSWGNFCVYGNYAYIAPPAWGEKVVQVVDVSVKTSPQVVISTPAFFPTCIATANGKLYGVGSDGSSTKFWVYNLTDPAEPAVDGSCSSVYSGESLVLNGDRAYVACEGNGMEIFDISTPTNPVKLPGYNPTYPVNNISVNNNLACIAAGEDNGLIILDVTDTNNIVEKGKFKDIYAMKVSVASPYAYVMVSSIEPLVKIDISDPENPTKLGGIESPPWANTLITNGQWLFMVSEKLWVYNLSDPQNPTLLATYDEWPGLENLFVEGSVLYAIKNDQMLLLNVSDPENILQLASYQATEDIKTIFVSSGYAYLSLNTYGAGVEIVNVSNPDNPVKVDASISFTGSVSDIFVGNGTACLAGYEWDGDPGQSNELYSVKLFNVSSPASPTEGGSITPAGENPYVWAMGNTLFVSSEVKESYPYTPCLEAFDISNLSSPQLAGEMNPAKVGYDLQVVDLGGGVPLILTASPGGSVHTYSYSSGPQTFTTGESCPSPSSYKLTAAPSPSSRADYVVVTNDSSYGIYTQEIVCGGNPVEPVLTLTPGPQNPAPETEQYSVKTEIGYKLTDKSFTRLAAAGVPAEIIAKLLKDIEYTSDAAFLTAIQTQLGANDTALYKDKIFEHAMTIWAEDVPIIHIVLSANDVDDWLVTSLTFQSSGKGNEKEGEDVVEVRLYLNSINGSLLGTTTYSADDGSVSFSMSEIIEKGSSKSFIMVYDFDAEKACPCNTYQSDIHMGQVAALPINDPNFVKLPPIPEGVTGGPTKVKKGIPTKMDGDSQYGETEQPLPKPFKVKMTYEDPECVKHVDFTMGPEAASFGAKFSNGQTSSRVNVDAYNEAQETLTLGTECGMKKPYYAQATPSHNGADCLYSESTVFTSWGAGVDLATSAEHDGTGEGDDKFATFISAIQAENKFTIEIDMAPEDFAEVQEVIFNLGGTVKTGTMVTQNKKYEAVFDMAAFDKPQTLLITVKMKKDGNDIEEQGKYQVKALKLPSWVESVNAICDEESYSQDFDSEEEKYKFGFSYPTSFAWSAYVPSSIGLLGGLDNDLDIEFNAYAWYGINEISNFGATIKGKPTILGQEFDVEGGLNGTFNSDFAFQRGNGMLKASTSFDLPEKGYSKTFLVYCVPITVAVDLGGNVEIFVNGSAVLNKNLEFEKITVAPGTTVTGNITVSLSAVLGLAKLAASGSPAATVEIEVTYITSDGTTATWRGEIVVPLKVVGSIFWGLGSAELWSGQLGPWTFGDKGARSSSSFRSSLAEEGPASPRFISTSAMAMDTSGSRMVVWTGDTAVEPAPPNPDVYYRFHNGTAWSDSVPIIGGESPNQEWETDPAVVFISNGAALAAWTANAGAHTLDNLNDILAAQNIAYGVWDGASWSAPGLIIDDDEADGTVQLAYDGFNSKVMSVWMHDANTDHDIETRTEWKLLYSIYDPGDETWSAYQDVTGTASGSADFMPSLATDGSGNALVLWVKDGDGIFHQELDEVTDGTNVDFTNDDCNIYWSKWTGSAWADPLTLTTANSATELFPAVTFAPEGKALAVWVEKEGTTERLYYSVFTLLDSSWSPPLIITESPSFIEEPKVVVDSSGKTTVVWRGGSSRGSNLFSSWANMSDLIWSEPEQITHDDMVDWNISAALDSNGEVTTCWSKYDTSSGDESSGSGFGDGVNMAQTDPGSASLTGNYSDQGVDNDSDGFYDLLAVSVEVDVHTPGDYGVQAELYGTDRIATAEASAADLAAGTYTFELHFPGGIISDKGIDGPYSLKNVVVLDMNDSVVETAFEAAPYTTGAYTADQFEGSPLEFDKSEYEGVTDNALMTVMDADENTDPGTKQTISVRVVSTRDLAGIVVPLIETGNDTGIFTGEVGFNPASNSVTGQIHVVDHCIIQVTYEDKAPSYRWIESAVWLSLASAGDLDADGEVDLADAIIALKVISRIDSGVDISDYTSSESWVDSNHRVSIIDAIYILQKVAEIRE